MKKKKDEFKIHNSVFIPPSKCSNCGEMLDATTGIQEQMPNEGDVSICAACGQISVFDSELKLRAATESEIQNLKIDCPDIWQVMTGISAAFRAKRAMKNN
ncbi:MAG: hypothetical protein M3209_09630 [Acidobacteriota bacterium]|nr:hypothetical protein [Acidobacteriota bacterium]